MTVPAGDCPCISLIFPSVVSAELCCGHPSNPTYNDVRRCYSYERDCSNNKYPYLPPLKPYSLLPNGNFDSIGVVDVNNDGMIDDNDRYNPYCFVPINAPSQVKIRDFGKLFSGAVGVILLIAFILAFLYLILGGISWLTSGGDKSAIEEARNKIIAALIGLIIVAATWAIFQLVGGVIGFNILEGFKIPTFF